MPILISVIALIISISNFLFTVWKDQPRIDVNIYTDMTDEVDYANRNTILHAITNNVSNKTVVLSGFGVSKNRVKSMVHFKDDISQEKLRFPCVLKPGEIARIDLKPETVLKEIHIDPMSVKDGTLNRSDVKGAIISVFFVDNKGQIYDSNEISLDYFIRAYLAIDDRSYDQINKYLQLLNTSSSKSEKKT